MSHRYRGLVLASAVLATVVLTACARSVVGPTRNHAPAGGDEGVVSAQGIDRVGSGLTPISEGIDLVGGGAAPLEIVTALSPPNAVFRTTPPKREGTISGSSPLTVELNLCRTRAASEDDDLKFTYDFDGDGAIDAFGHCRATHVYENPGEARHCGPARACVSDRRAGGEVCRDYEVCIDPGRPAPTSTSVLIEESEVEPNDDGADITGVVEGNDFDPAHANVLRDLSGPEAKPIHCVTGRLNPSGDEDYFKVRVVGLALMDVSVQGPPGPSGDCPSTPVRIVIRRADGLVLENAAAACVVSASVVLPDADETFFVGVMAQDDVSTAADYRVCVEGNSGG